MRSLAAGAYPIYVCPSVAGLFNAPVPGRVPPFPPWEDDILSFAILHTRHGHFDDHSRRHFSNISMVASFKLGSRIL